MVIIISSNLFILLKMKNSLYLSYAFLVLLTITTALVACSFSVSAITGILIMILAAVKFVIVAFQFMELKKAHGFWKTGLIITLLLLVIVIVSLK